MATFTTQVEIHEARPGDAYTFNDEMHRRGFTRTIKGSDALYALPEFTYNFAGELDEQAVYRKAFEALQALDRSGAIIVTKSAGRFIGGLRKA
jgi:hypothetical protein